jgi:hypothetical protein
MDSSLANADIELYFSAQADGYGLVESPGSDSVVNSTPAEDYQVERAIYYNNTGLASYVSDSGWSTLTQNTESYAAAKARVEDYIRGGTYGKLPCTFAIVRTEELARSGLLVDYPGAAAAYSLRLLDTDYTGSAVRVRRASDNAEQDIGFDGNGDLDTSALATFCSGTDGFVKTWYDQSGNSNDATQVTTAHQPKIYDSATGVLTEHGKPCAQFDGTDDRFEITPTISAANGFIAACVSEISATGAAEVALNVRGANCTFGNLLFYNSSTGLTYASGRTSACVYEAVDASGMKSIAVGLWDWVNDTLSVEFDGVAVTPNTNLTETSTTINRIRLGVDAGTNYADCKIHECIIWPSNSLTIANISDDINTYYSIYA